VRQETPSIIDDLKHIEEDNKSDLSKVVDILLNDSYFRRKTRANRRLINSLTLVDTMSQIWDIEFFKTFIPTFTQYLTSQDGKARQEIVDITKYTLDKEREFRSDVMQSMGRR
jgi:hypothetical protein